MTTATSGTGRESIATLKAEIVDYLRLATRPGDVIELRILKVVDNPEYPAFTVAGYFDADHLGELAAEALRWTDKAEGVYVTINPVLPDLLSRVANRAKKRPEKTTGDAEVARRVGLVIDADPVRPAGISSTAAEKAAAWERIEAVRLDLEARGFPAPVVADSGNGYHLRYGIELPADDGGLVERCLKALAAKHSDDTVSIDASLFNASRIIKLYGTMARKGDHVDSRPHRRARMISAPERLEFVPRDLLEALAAECPEEPKPAPKPAKPKPPKADGNASRRNGPARKDGAGVYFPETDLPPVEDFEARTDWPDILPEGWREDREAGQWTYHTRPGKPKGVSASVRDNWLHVFTDNAPPFEPNRNYSKFSAWALLNHQGDEKAAVKDLVQRGFGRYIDHDGEIKQNPPPKGWARRRPRGQARQAGGPAAVRPRKDGGAGRPEIEISVRRHEALEQTIRALEGDADLFRRGDSLGLVIQEETDTAKLPGGVELRHARGNLRFVPLSPPVLGCRLTRLASFYSVDTDRHGEEVTADCHPPDWLIKAVAEHHYWPGVRDLLTITECPYVTADGSLATPGFDRATGALYRPSVAIPPLPDRPDQADAMAAVDRLCEVVGQFPFDDHAFAVWLAYLLTAIQRPSIAGPTPGFAFNGNLAGVGKGLLIDLVGILVWGYPVGTRAYPTDPAEAEKVKLSLALAAVPVVHFDNLTEGGCYGGGVIDSALTTMFAEGRILGYTRESGVVPLRPVWTLSGNNVSPIKDAHRRWIPCNLVTTLERPHERADIRTRDLRAYALEHRGSMLRDALTILKAHALAGRPVGPAEPKNPDSGDWAPLGSYEEWDLIVRGAIWFAMRSDCLVAQRQGEEDRPDRADKAALLLGWQEIDPAGDGRTAGEALQLAEDHPELYPTLRSALLALSRDNKLPGLDRLQYKLRSMRRTPINKMRFETCGEIRGGASRNGAKLWRVVAC